MGTIVTNLDTLPEDVLQNPAFFVVGTTLLGMTPRGGVKWNPGKKWGKLTYDGQRTTMVGDDRIDGYESKLSATVLQLGPDERMKFFEPGATIAAGTGTITKVLTPKDAGKFLVAGDYATDVRAIWPLNNGAKYYEVILPYALCLTYEITGAADGEGEIPVEFEGRLARTQPLGAAPYLIHELTALPTTT